MVSSSTAVHETNFTVSVDAIKNIRLEYLLMIDGKLKNGLMDDNSKPEDLEDLDICFH